MPDNLPGKITVLIVDDHAMVRQGLRTFLELYEDFSVVGEAGDGRAAVDACSLLKPQVVLMDLVMPEMDGITATRQISSLGLGTRVIALTSFIEDEKVISAIQAGACGYLLKDVSPDELIDALRAVSRGEARLHPEVTRRLMHQVAAQPKPSSSPVDLTGRELEVLRLIAQGKSNQAIADALVISEKTVKTHVSSLLSKLQLEDRTQLAIYALKHGLVETE